MTRARALKCSYIVFSGFLEDAASGRQVGEIACAVPDGNRIMAEAVFLHSAGRTAIFTDLIQHVGSGVG